MDEEKIAVIGDIHANLEALNAILDDARSQSVTTFNCVGDVVGYNANPEECAEIVRDICPSVICGNHDFYCSHDKPLDDFQPNAALAIDWTRRQIKPETVEWLGALPMSKTFFPKSFSLVHGTLDMPELWGYVFDVFDADAHFTYQPTPICFHGHTHVPAVFEKRGTNVERYEAPPPGTRVSLAFGRKYFINVGSVGQPRDGNPDASYLIYEPRSRIVEFRRVKYDVQAASEKVRKAGLPDRLADRLLIGR